MDSFITDLPKLVSIFALAFFYFWPAIPAGLALGLSPVAVIAATTLSYVCGVALVALLGARVRDVIMGRFARRRNINSQGRLKHIWERYGLFGLGLAAPMTVGSQIGTALGLALNAQPRRLVFFMSLGALVWSVSLTIITTLGILTFQVTK